MSLRWLADALVVLHLSFIVFALFGGLLVWRRRWLAWLHLPALAWAAGIELFGGACPLTALENRWRLAAGEAGYGDGFVAHYLLPILYPQALTREIQILLGLGVLLLNAVVYALLWRRLQTQSRGGRKSV